MKPFLDFLDFRIPEQNPHLLMMWALVSSTVDQFPRVLHEVKERNMGLRRSHLLGFERQPCLQINGHSIAGFASKVGHQNGGEDTLIVYEVLITPYPHV